MPFQTRTEGRHAKPHVAAARLVIVQNEALELLVPAAVQPLFLDPIADVDVPKARFSAYLFAQGRLACSRRSSNEDVGLGAYAHVFLTLITLMSENIILTTREREPHMVPWVAVGAVGIIASFLASFMTGELLRITQIVGQLQQHN